jgi:hypothetical protein
VAAELSQAGLQVTQSAGPIPPDITIRIIGNIIEIHARMDAGIRATVRTDIIVTKDGAAVLARQYTGSSSVAVLVARPSADDYRRALEAALQDAMKNAVPEILANIQ